MRFALPNGWGFLMQRCMIELGFDAYTYSRIGGFTNGLNRASSVGQEGLAWYHCSQDFPEVDVVHTRLEEPQLAALYEYYATWLVPCLEANGVRVVEVPSYAEFSEPDAGRPGWWNPYLSSERPTSIAAVDEQFEKCEPYSEPAGQ